MKWVGENAAIEPTPVRDGDAPGTGRDGPSRPLGSGIAEVPLRISVGSPLGDGGGDRSQVADFDVDDGGGSSMARRASATFSPYTSGLSNGIMGRIRKSFSTGTGIDEIGDASMAIPLSPQLYPIKGSPVDDRFPKGTAREEGGDQHRDDPDGFRVEETMTCGGYEETNSGADPPSSRLPYFPGLVWVGSHPRTSLKSLDRCSVRPERTPTVERMECDGTMDSGGAAFATTADLEGLEFDDGPPSLTSSANPPPLQKTRSQLEMIAQEAQTDDLTDLALTAVARSKATGEGVGDINDGNDGGRPVGPDVVDDRHIARQLLDYFRYRPLKKKIMTITVIVSVLFVLIDFTTTGQIRAWMDMFLVWMEIHTVGGFFVFIGLFIITTREFFYAFYFVFCIGKVFLY